MAEEKEKTVQKSYRLPVAQVELIDQLTWLGIFGSTKSAVMRALLDRAINEIIKDEFVRKYKETKDLLKKK